MSPLRAAGTRGSLPLSGATRITLAGNDLSFADIGGDVAGGGLRGKLSVALQKPRQVQGNIEADSVDGLGLVAAAIGMPAAAGNALWSGEPFASGAFGDFAGQVALKVHRLDLLPRLTAREFSATLRLASNEFTLDDMSGDVTGGRLTGQISFGSGQNGIKAHGKMALTGVDATSLQPVRTRPAVTGVLNLSG